MVELTASVGTAVQTIVDDVLSLHEVQLYDLEFSGGALRVVLEAADDVDIDKIAHISRGISRKLDETDPIPGAYQLEVTTPGLERRLRTQHHFRSAVGEVVNIKMQPGFEGPRRFNGVVTSCSENQVELALAGSTESVTLPIEAVDRAMTVFEWGNPEKPITKSSTAGSHKKVQSAQPAASAATANDGTEIGDSEEDDTEA